MKIWQKKVSILGLLFLAMIFIACVLDLPNLNDCSICGYIKCHAPCSLNLATGDIDELQLYTPHDQKVGELAEEQTGGTFGFISVAGLRGIKLTDPWYIEFEVPTIENEKRVSHYCGSCRERLEGYECGFVLLDIYDLNNPIIYRIENGTSYEIRCYKIEITANQEDENYLLRVDGAL